MQEHGIDFQKILSLGYAGKLDITKKEEDAVFKGIWKQLRYAYDLPDLLWSHSIRGWDRDREGNFSFKSQKLEEAMFNEELLSLKMYEENLPGAGSEERGLKKAGYEPVVDENGEVKKDDNGEVIYDLEKRKQIARNIFAYLIAKDLHAHRKMIGGYKLYTSTELALIRTFFTKYGWGVKEEEGGYDVDAISYFFTDWEFDKIEQMGHSVYKDIFMRELGASSLGASITSLGEGLKQFIRAVLKG